MRNSHIVILLIAGAFAAFIYLSCSDPVANPADDLEGEFRNMNPKYTGQLIYGYNLGCRYPCWSYFLDTVPVQFDFRTIDFVGSQAAVYGALDTMICDGEQVPYIFADSIIEEQSDSQFVEVAGHIIPAPYFEFGCSDFRLVTECDTIDFQPRELLLDTLPDDETPLADYIGYELELTGYFWEQACHHRLAVTEVAALESEVVSPGFLLECDTVDLGCDRYAFLAWLPGINWLGRYSLDTDLDLSGFLPTDTLPPDTCWAVLVYGRMVYPKPFVSVYPVLALDSIFCVEQPDCTAVIRDDPRRL
jgi:hypothetical protein